MASKRVTLADVARAAGVSSSTASFVLSGRADEMRISPAMQATVRATATELGYRRNILSASLRRGTTSTLGFVSDTVTTSAFAGEMIRGALDASHAAGLMLFIGETGGEPEEERRIVEAMADRQVDGVVLASMYTQRRAVPQMPDGLPAVLLNMLAGGDTAPGAAPSHDAVVPDEYAAGRAAARLVLDAGHRRVHLLGVGDTLDEMPVGTVAGEERLAGILHELRAAGIAPASRHGSRHWEPEVGWRTTNALLETGARGEAIIAFNDRLAFGAYQAITEAGLTIPAGMSVVSFDDDLVAAWLRPGLTTFALPHYDLGHRAVELLAQQVRARRSADAGEPIAGPKTHRIPLPLRVRGSLGPARD